MKKDGLERMLDFLNYFEEKGIHFFLEQISPDSIQATLTLVGMRIEVAFFVHEIQFSVFRGSEAVEIDEDILKKLIEENWD